MADGNANRNEIATEAGGSPTLIATVFPSQANAISIGAAALGVLFVVLPFVFKERLLVAEYQGNLLICVGVALILAAAGSQATFKIGGFVLAGAAAVAVGLYVMLESEREKVLHELREGYVRGTLLNVDKDKYSSLRIKFRRNIVGSYDLTNSQYEFVAFKSDIETPLAAVELTTKADPERPISIRISHTCFDEALGSGSPLVWEYSENDSAILDQKQGSRVIGRFRNQQPNPALCGQVMSDAGATLPATQLAAGEWSLLFSTAWAQPTPSRPMPELIEKLKSDDTDIRRAARDQLALVPIEGLRPVLDAFGVQYDNYRVKLGVSVAFAEMLRTQKDKAPAISKLLTDDDRNRLIDAAGDKDRTVRIYATEFLFDLEDAQAALLAIKRAATTKDDVARYQWIFSAQGGWAKLTQPQKQELKPTLELLRGQSIGQAQTLKLLDKLS